MCWSVFQAVLTSFKCTILKVNNYSKEEPSDISQAAHRLFSQPAGSDNVSHSTGTSPKRLRKTEVPDFRHLQISFISLSEQLVLQRKAVSFRAAEGTADIFQSDYRSAENLTTFKPLIFAS